MSTTLINQTLEILHRHNFPGTKLCLEVTESTKLNFNNHTLGVIEKLQGHDIMIALDDFGTGYSSFNNMKNLPVRLVKTDHTFIKGIEKDYFMQYFYHIITELAHKTGMKLVVEGVETLEQLEIMLKNGVDYIQGYYFGRPMPATEVAGSLENFTRLNPPQVSGGFDLADTRAMPGGRESYLITTNTFNIQTRCMQILMNATDLECAFNEVLEIVGTHYNTSRAYLYQRKRGSLTYNHSFEWCRAGEKPHQKALKLLNTAELYEEWMRILRKRKMIVASDINTLSPGLARFCRGQDVGALAIIPIWDNGHMMGFVGLDDSGYRNWQPEEIIMLKNLGLMMASCLKQHRLETHAGAGAAEQVLNSLEMPLFVSDLQTCRILWANEAMHRATGQDSLVGKTCHAVTRACDKRCEGCQSTLLLNDAAQKQVCREYHDEKTGRSYLIYNTLTTWQGSQRAQIEYLVELTGLQKEQSLLDSHTGEGE